MFFSLTYFSFSADVAQIDIRLVQTSDTVDCDMDLKLDGDHSEVLGLQTNVTVLLKVKVKAEVWNFGS